MDRWVGHVAMVTGAASGIGYAVTQNLIKHGMRVAALDRNIGFKKFEKNLHKNGYLKEIKCDITKVDEVKAAIGWIETNWGGINVLVNSAGLGNLASLTSGTGEGICKMFETNVIGLTICTREVTTSMRKHRVKMGHIINISSVCAHFISSWIKFGAYAASKHSVKILTQLTRSELIIEKLPIRLTSISPGLVATEMTKGYMRPGSLSLLPEDISNCVIFALSTPQNVNVTELILQSSGEITNSSLQNKY